DCGDGAPRLYETASGQERRRFGTAPVVDIESNSKAPPAPAPAGFIDLDMSGFTNRDVAISPDGRLLAYGQPGGSIALWDIAAAKEVAQLQGHQADVTVLTFSADGRTLASGSRDTSVLLWDVAKYVASAKRQPAKFDAATRWNELQGNDAVRA